MPLSVTKVWQQNNHQIVLRRYAFKSSKIPLGAEQMATKRASSVHEDPTIINLLEKMPSHVRQSFNEEQLAHLRNALVGRKWQHHALDMRGTVPWFNYRYYYVVIAGKNKRQLSRTEKQVSSFMMAAFVTVLLTLSTLFGLLLLYLLKSALGINLFEDFSLGIWGWFRS